MSKNNGKDKIHPKNRDNIIMFPKPPPSGDSSRKKDVESEPRYTIHFEPDWDTNEHDPKDSQDRGLEERKT